MITLVSCPKPFRDHFAVIQRNALKSWTLLDAKPEIILIGEETGIEEAATEFGAHHIRHVERNEYGTPLVNSVFSQAEKAAANDLLCYLNTDIILPSPFSDAVSQLHKIKNKFLGIGYRWNVDINDPIDFDADWERKLTDYVRKTSPYPRTAGSDYFIFPRGMWREIPPFAIGRGYWNSWLVYAARAMRVPVIDASPIVKVIHQNHDYSLPGKAKEIDVWYGSEAARNRKLSGGIRHDFDLKDATYLLKATGLEPATERKRRFRLLFTTAIIFSESSPFLLPCLWSINATLRLREIARTMLKGKPHERKMTIWQDYLRFN